MNVPRKEEASLTERRQRELATSAAEGRSYLAVPDNTAVKASLITRIENLTLTVFKH